MSTFEAGYPGRCGERDLERRVIERYGIDAPGTTTCFACDLRHYSGIDCPPVLPLGTEYQAGTT